MSNLLFRVVFLFGLIFLLNACNTQTTKPASAQNQSGLTAPLIFAHRASSGLWIQNSRNAVKNTVELFMLNQKNQQSQFHGIEVDIVLTADNVPVLAHDPWVHKRLCRRRDGQDLKEVLITHVTLRTLQSDYLCGGIRDTEFPRAVTREGSFMSLDEFLTVAGKAPELMIYLDIKLQPPLTGSITSYAKAIMKSLDKAAIQNPIFIEGPDAIALNAYKQYASQKITTVLSYPPFFANQSPWLTGASAAVNAIFHPNDALKKIQEAKANAIASPTQVANLRLRKALQEKGTIFITFTPNTKDDLRKACLSGANIIITDFPTLGPCPTP